MGDILYMVIPCYNEQEVLPETSRQLSAVLHGLISSGKIGGESRIVFVDDGSKDGTWQLIEELHRSDGIYTGIKLSRNRGHQNALLAGLMSSVSRADMMISMDADLQDDVAAIEAMVDKYHEGNDIVYGVRSSRQTDTAFKRSTAQGFYKLMNGMGAETVYNHADFRLMSRRAVEGLSQFGEVNLFLRGIVPMIGYPADKVYYERRERFAGESKYPFKKMLSFAIEGITSLSTEPLQKITTLGFTVFLVSIAILIYCLVRHFTGHTITGWTTIALSVWAIGGLILLSLGVIGEYIGKIYLESKERPRYIIEKDLSSEDGISSDARGISR